MGDDYDLKVVETYCIASSVEDTIPPHGIQLTSLSVAQETLLSLLERHVQLKTQAETHASSCSRIDVQSRSRHCESGERSNWLALWLQAPSVMLTAFSTIVYLMSQMDTCMTQWDGLYAHTYASHVLVVDMEASHVQIVSNSSTLS